jgi:hypothetical protein
VGDIVDEGSVTDREMHQCMAKRENQLHLEETERKCTWDFSEHDRAKAQA